MKAIITRATIISRWNVPIFWYNAVQACILPIFSLCCNYHEEPKWVEIPGEIEAKDRFQDGIHDFFHPYDPIFIVRLRPDYDHMTESFRAYLGPDWKSPGIFIGNHKLPFAMDDNLTTESFTSQMFSDRAAGLQPGMKVVVCWDMANAVVLYRPEGRSGCP